MNICVFGAGAVGGWIAARLAASGNRVTAVTSGGQLERIEVDEQGSSVVVDLQSFEGPADVLVIALKATALASAAPEAGKWIDDRTIILPMLNGVPWWFFEGDTTRPMDEGSPAANFPFAQIIGCVVHASCYRKGPARIAVSRCDKLIVGEPGGARSERVEEIFKLLDEARLRPQITSNIRGEIWYKLWGNATMNPLSALTRATCDRILAAPECRAWLLEGMDELARIGAAIGCPVRESGEERLAVTARLGAFKTSMLQDVEAGRPIELEALLGSPLEIARRTGIETPALDRLYGAARVMAESERLI